MLQTKALYNLLRLNAAEDPSITVEPWALEDLRSIPVSELLDRLKDYSVGLDSRSFIEFSRQCDTPEDLTELLLAEEEAEENRDPFYLLVFELWRRLVPDKQSLSIFCDELDYRIALYDEEDLDSEELIQDSLANLLEVLDENADTGAEPEDVFLAICDYCAHDIESFLYDYISDLIDSGNSLYASELIDGFSGYITEPLWFDFLRLRLLSFTDIADASIAMHRLLESDIDLPLLLEMLEFVGSKGERELFKLTLDRILPLLADEQEYTEVMLLVAEYYRQLNQEEMEYSVQKLLQKRAPGPVNPSDIQILQNLLARE